jgi:hypothetical protein
VSGALLFPRSAFKTPLSQEKNAQSVVGCVGVLEWTVKGGCQVGAEVGDGVADAIDVGVV